MALDQSALLEVLEVLKVADGGARFADLSGRYGDCLLVFCGRESEAPCRKLIYASAPMETSGIDARFYRRLTDPKMLFESLMLQRQLIAGMIG